MTEIKEVIQKLADPNPTAKSVIGTVRSVDMNAKTCDVEVEESFTRYGVRLTAIEDQADTGFIIEPKQGSDVHIRKVEGELPLWEVSLFSEVESVRMKNDSGAEILLKSNGQTHLHGDQFGGLVKIGKLQDNLNSIKTMVDAMNVAIPAALTAVGVGNAANGGTGSTSYTTAMSSQSINIQNMENTDVKHG